MSPGRLKRCDVEKAVDQYDELLDYLTDIVNLLKLQNVKYLPSYFDEDGRARIMERLKERLRESNAPKA